MIRTMEYFEMRSNKRHGRVSFLDIFCKEMRAQIKTVFLDKPTLSAPADNVEKPTLSERNPYYLIR